eukprot:7190440-Pyramimonas_sp.AAC.1
MKWCRSIQKPIHYAAAYSTAFRCLKDILSRPIASLYIIGMDFHKGGTQAFLASGVLRAPLSLLAQEDP